MLITKMKQWVRAKTGYIAWLSLWIALFYTPEIVWAQEAQRFSSKLREGLHCVVTDYANFYRFGNIGKAALGLGIAGVIANTDADQKIRDWYQKSVRSSRTDELAKFVKPLGDGMMTIPPLVGIALLGELAEDTRLGSTAGTWAQGTLRAMLVGVPPLLGLQKVLGASRPNEANSYWHPFEDNNGVSGHSFMGAVPFLTAAKMTKSPFLKVLFYVSSSLCGLSRINDDKHYVSQVAFGWWLANLSADAVHRTETKTKNISLTPVVTPTEIGISVSFRF